MLCVASAYSGLWKKARKATGKRESRRKSRLRFTISSTNSAERAHLRQTLAAVFIVPIHLLAIRRVERHQCVGAAGGLGAALGAACGSGALGGCCGGAGMPDFALYVSITALVISMLGTAYRTSGACC